VHRVGNGVSPPAVIFKTDPEYSEIARKLYARGAVMLTIIVDPNGTARDIKVVKSLGFGLDEKAIEAVEKWKFRPGMKSGQPVNVRATIEVNFRLIQLKAGTWCSGPMAFALEGGLTPPVVRGGAMPKPDGDDSNESVVLGFTVDSTGSVTGIHSISGSESASELLTRNLATWKFQPAMKGNEPVDATGTVNFFKGP
jgi:TonB family protein